jgi:hypothetical protein
MSFNDYLDRQTGDDLKPAGAEQWRGFSGYATGATARSKQALVPAAWLQFPYLRRDQYELGLEAGLLDTTYPLDYTDYLRTVEDVLCTHALAAGAECGMLVRVRGQVQEVLRQPRVHADAGIRSCPLRAPDRGGRRRTRGRAAGCGAVRASD